MTEEQLCRVESPNVACRPARYHVTLRPAWSGVGPGDSCRRPSSPEGEPPDPVPRPGPPPWTGPADRRP